MKEFYKKQFEPSNYDINKESWLEQVAKDGQEQVGHSFPTMFELGAGNGGFAQEQCQG